MLSIHNVHHFLISRRWISGLDIIKNRYKVEHVKSFKNIFHVTSGDNELCIKQVDPNSLWSIKLMPKYVQVLKIINEVEHYKKLRLFLPEFYGFDDQHNFLVTSYLSRSENVDEYVQRHGHLSIDLLSIISDIVALIGVNISKELGRHDGLTQLPKGLPWILDIFEKNNEETRHMLLHSKVISEVERQPVFCEIINKARALWIPTSLIHGDIKWSNFLINSFDESPLKILLTDWETADIGDPLWDLAGIIQNVICNNIFRFQIVSESIPRPVAFEIADCIPVLSNVILRYHKKLNLTCDSLSAKKVLTYTSARLIQTASESNGIAQDLSFNAQRTLEAGLYVYSNIVKLSDSIN